MVSAERVAQPRAGYELPVLADRTELDDDAGQRHTGAHENSGTRHDVAG